jgi:hypothetical protein
MSLDDALRAGDSGGNPRQLLVIRQHALNRDRRAVNESAREGPSFAAESDVKYAVALASSFSSIRDDHRLIPVLRQVLLEADRALYT